MVEIPADTLVGEAVRILSDCNILSAPVRDSEAETSSDWRSRYIGIVDYSSIILWVMDSAEIAAATLSVGTATAAGIGAGAVGALGAMAVGMAGPAAVAGLAAAAVGAAVAGGVAADNVAGKDGPEAADNLGEDFYRVILREEPFKSTTVSLMWLLDIAEILYPFNVIVFLLIFDIIFFEKDTIEVRMCT